MTTHRRAGALVHPTSFPSRHGIGDLGPAADQWISWLADTGCAVWQVLPLGPTGYGDSPYQCFSSFAGNPYLISPEILVEDGLLRPNEMEAIPVGPIDYGSVIPRRVALLDTVADRFDDDPDFSAFCTAERDWLDDFALFMAIKESEESRSWTSWPVPLRDRHPAAIARARERLDSRVRAHQIRQYLFFRQWARVRDLAAAASIQIIGDAPIFVAHDSADVWTNRELFTVDDTGALLQMAGVPPDYFSPTGQLWGNPLYRWDVHARTGYRWWIDRLRSVLGLVDVVRIDHFRAFADYWSIPAGAPTAETGVWLDGPSDGFFAAVGDALGGGRLPIIAEDLGDLSPAVGELRDRLGLPGMKILQFAFDGDPENPFLPQWYPTNCVVYTGTHDNETVVGWLGNATDEERAAALAFVGGDGSDFCTRMLETAWHSRADLAVAPLQDLLCLGNEARMNTPGVAEGNWRWRYHASDLTDELAMSIRIRNEQSGRIVQSASTP